MVGPTVSIYALPLGKEPIQNIILNNYSVENIYSYDVLQKQFIL